ncbi:MAG: hypothetical protein ACJ73D_04310 [Pyrinomonadaceae bacterium]
MRASVLLISVTIVIFGSVASALGQIPNFSGTWIMTGSDAQVQSESAIVVPGLTHLAKPPVSGQRVIDQDAMTLRETYYSSTIPSATPPATKVYYLDGRGETNPVFTDHAFEIRSKTQVDGARIAVDAELVQIATGKTQSKFKYFYKLSEDGKTLKVDQIDTGPIDGITITTTYVYKRKI